MDLVGVIEGPALTAVGAQVCAFTEARRLLGEGAVREEVEKRALSLFPNGGHVALTDKDTCANYLRKVCTHVCVRVTCSRIKEKGKGGGGGGV